MGAFIYGLAGLALLAAAQLWPSKEGVWLIQLSPFYPEQHAVGLISQMPVKLIDAVGGGTFIVRAEKGVSALQLMQMGAALVVEAPVGLGCAPTEKQISWQRKESVQ